MDDTFVLSTGFCHDHQRLDQILTTIDTTATNTTPPSQPPPPPPDPEGLEGWSPDDFQPRPPPGQQEGGGRGGGGGAPRVGRPPPAHPDVEQPGPGRNDWDSMYG
jgi:hypothetical protein